jgi:hypothetical protein
MASKTQISALQLQRHLELGSYRSAWFLCHRIRFALKEIGPVAQLSGTVESDETWVGGKVKRQKHKFQNKTAVVSLVERGGRVRSTVFDRVSGRSITRLLRQHVAATAHLNTDESPFYQKAGKHFASHDAVNHRDQEYVRHDGTTGRLATTNTVEGFFGNTKRSIDGTHHHVSRKYLPLYMAEFDHKYNLRKVTDGERTDAGIARIVGKRLTYKWPKASR